MNNEDTTMEGLGVEKEERRRFLKALQNIVSQEIREALKALWVEVNHRFEMMDSRFKELTERFDRHEKRTNERLDEFREAIKGDFRSFEKRVDVKLEAIKELLLIEKEANEKRHRTTIWVFGTAMTVTTLFIGLLTTLIALNLTGILD